MCNLYTFCIPHYRDLICSLFFFQPNNENVCTALWWKRERERKRSSMRKNRRCIQTVHVSILMQKHAHCNQKWIYEYKFTHKIVHENALATVSLRMHWYALYTEFRLGSIQTDAVRFNQFEKFIQQI